MGKLIKSAAAVLTVYAAFCASLQSCAVVKVLSADHGESLVAPDTLKARYAAEGIIEDHWITPTVDGPTMRHLLVYLPADYYASNKSYPVVYLFHGARGNELSWITEGHVLNVIDSLVANGMAREAIFVLPNMNQYDDDQSASVSRFKKPFDSFFSVDGAVESGFVDDVLKFIENKYRIISDKDHRAIAGLSIGAFQAAYISAARPELFDYVGLFSPFFLSYVTGGKYSWFYNGLEEKLDVQFADPPHLYFMAIGKWDFYYEHIWNARGYFTRKGYPFVYYEGKGGHDWKSWPGFFSEFYKKIF